MNILTFDIEEWFAEETLYGNREEMYVVYDNYLNRILDLLDTSNKKATFFCVGKLVPKYSSVIKLIANRGHEVGCHSNEHKFLNKITRQEVLEDTKAAVDAIEQVVGQKVISYRAPAFSIDENNKWVFEILAECGIERDASVFPAARDFGGFPHFGQKMPCIVEYNGIYIKEFPICTTKVLGKEIAYSGGGYFRFFPLGFVEKQMKKSPYTMCYFHIGDVIQATKGVMSKEEYEAYFKEAGTLKARYVRYLKSNLGKKNAFSKMMRLIDKMEFVNLQQAEKSINWNHSTVVNI